MGSLGGISQNDLWVLFLALVPGIILAIITIKPLNALLLGETYAITLGVNIRKVRVLIFISTCILTGTITAFCGPIGFIGVAVPHLCRMLFRTASHSILIPASALVGASVLLASDIISQLPGSDITLPINSVTALVGIPVIVWIVIRNQRHLS
jgi:iron complex transport system permease protein